jgi:hypothetical protein
MEPELDCAITQLSETFDGNVIERRAEALWSSDRTAPVTKPITPAHCSCT